MYFSLYVSGPSPASIRSASVILRGSFIFPCITHIILRRHGKSLLLLRPANSNNSDSNADSLKPWIYENGMMNLMEHKISEARLLIIFTILILVLLTCCSSLHLTNMPQSAKSTKAIPDFSSILAPREEIEIGKQSAGGR